VLTAASDTDPAAQSEKKNQRWMISDAGLWAWFSARVREAGMIPSMYFIHDSAEDIILNDSFVDGTFPALARHQSMYWIYRSLSFLKGASLPIPDRIDFSSYPTPSATNYATLYNRVLSDGAATIPALLGGPHDMFFAETFNHPDPATRAQVQKGVAAQYAAHPELRGVTIWSTPDSGGPGVHTGYPFDLAGFSAADIHSLTFTNPSFEVDGACGTADGETNPAGACTEWTNGNVTLSHSGRSTAAAEDGSASLELTSGACATSPCSGTFPGLYVLGDGATGAVAGGWAAARLWARSSTADGAAQAILIDQGSSIASSVSLVQSGAFTEYVLLGPVGSTDVRARFQIVSPAQTTTAYFDAFH
jgi:hypothetical protein